MWQWHEEFAAVMEFAFYPSLRCAPSSLHSHPLPAWEMGCCFQPAFLAGREEAANQKDTPGSQAAPGTGCSCCPRRMTSYLLMSSGTASLGEKRLDEGEEKEIGRWKHEHIFQHGHLFFPLMQESFCISLLYWACVCACRCLLPVYIPPNDSQAFITCVHRCWAMLIPLYHPNTANCASEFVPQSQPELIKFNGGAFFSACSTYTS